MILAEDTDDSFFHNHAQIELTGDMLYRQRNLRNISRLRLLQITELPSAILGIKSSATEQT